MGMALFLFQMRITGEDGGLGFGAATILLELKYELKEAKVGVMILLLMASGSMTAMEKSIVQEMDTGETGLVWCLAQKEQSLEGSAHIMRELVVVVMILL